MSRPSFEDWLEREEGDLRYEYAEYLAQKDLDHLVEQVLWWEAVKDANKAREAWETWVWATYEEACASGPEREEYEER